MTDEIKDAAEQVAEATSESSANTSNDTPKKKKSKKKLGLVIGVIAAVVVVAGVGFFVWHEQPSFCNAICHTPMDAYLPTYESDPNASGIDKWGNKVEYASSMLAPTHRAQNENTCLSCHVPTISEQVNEGVAWVTGNYETVTTQTGMQVVPEKSLKDLTAASGKKPDEFCLNSSCHNMTRQQLIEVTADYERNPHMPQHGEVMCSECHKAHRASVNYCSKCHSDSPIPEGWLNQTASDKLVKALKK